MMYLSKTIDSSRTPLLIGEFYDDAVLARLQDGRVLRVPRELIETPVLCCDRCAKPCNLKVEKRTKKKYAECPDHARHMYDTMYAASHDIKNYTHKQRRKFGQQAIHWLKIWQKVFEKRTNQKVAEFLFPEQEQANETV